MIAEGVERDVNVRDVNGTIHVTNASHARYTGRDGREENFMLKYVRRDPQEIEGISDPCGTVWPMFTESDTSVAEFFIVESHDAIPHYHTKITEFYHVIDGSGKLILDDEEVELHKGVTVMINPGTTHRAVGDLSVIVVCVPAGVYQDTHEVEEVN